VENRNLHRLLQLFLDVETFRGLDVFEIDAAEGRFENLAGPDHFVGILGRQFDIEHVDIGEAFEQDSLSFHDRLTRQRPDVAEAEDRGSVAHDGNQVGFGGVLVGERGIALDLFAGDGHARGIGEAQIPLRPAGLRRRHGNLPGRGRGVIFQGVFRVNRHRGFLTQISIAGCLIFRLLHAGVGLMRNAAIDKGLGVGSGPRGTSVPPDYLGLLAITRM
jgi:hypothetical protein